MRSTVAIVMVILSGAASAQELRHKPADAEATIDRGLAFLARDAMAWKNEHNCVSCRSGKGTGSWAKIGELERISQGGLSTRTVGSCRGGKILGPTRQRVDVPAGMHSLALRARMSLLSALPNLGP